MMIDFNSKQSTLLLNPKIGLEEQENIHRLLEENGVYDRYLAHLFIASSGTSRKNGDDLKLVALSKNAILASAKAVNHYLKVTKKDVWLNSLPVFHVGGVGILARAYLTESKVTLLEKWDPQKFLELIQNNNVTLTSLVPAQVFDLVLHQFQPPKDLRTVIVGGGAINQKLYEEAVLLGWPLVLSYGMSENSSQIATSKLNCQDLCFLNHVEAKINSKGYLMVKSSSLLSGYIYVADNKIRVTDPKTDEWFETEDFASIEGNVLKVSGRASDYIKIGGEGVIFSYLEKQFEEIKTVHKVTYDAAIIAVPNDRLGFVIHLVTTCPEIQALVADFNALVMPYERIREVHFAKKIPRTQLNKLCKAKLLEQIFLD